MDKKSIRVTYAVDAQTVAAIDQLARDWGVSKSEAMRRAVRSARERVDAQFSRMTPLEILDYSRNNPHHSEEEIEAWHREVRALRKSWGTSSEPAR